MGEYLYLVWRVFKAPGSPVTRASFAFVTETDERCAIFSSLFDACQTVPAECDLVQTVVHRVDDQFVLAAARGALHRVLTASLPKEHRC